MDTEANRRALRRANPHIYKTLLDLEAQAQRDASVPDPQYVTFIWIEAYGHEIEWGRAIGWADAKAECIRRSMTNNGWAAGEHRLTPDEFIVVPGHLDIRALLLKCVEREHGPRLPPTVEATHRT